MGHVVAPGAEPPGLAPVPRALHHPQHIISLPRPVLIRHTNDAEKPRYVSFRLAPLRVLRVQSISTHLIRSISLPAAVDLPYHARCGGRRMRLVQGDGAKAAILRIHVGVTCAAARARPRAY